MARWSTVLLCLFPLFQYAQQDVDSVIRIQSVPFSALILNPADSTYNNVGSPYSGIVVYSDSTEKVFNNGSVVDFRALAVGNSIRAVRLQGKYDNGEFSGTKTFLNRFGPARLESYNNGQLDGAWSEYYNGGRPKQEGRYRLGKKHGDWRRYFLNGIVMENGTYKNGNKTNVWITYNEQGVEMQRETHD